MKIMTIYLFQHPERPEPWTKPFIADELGAACTQVEIGVVWLTNPLWVRYNENCLNLNVFAPNVR
jgi:carboxylesterase type B